MELISVIVPIYNVVNYLDKCIESILNQTYSELEIILVNDGSTDSSLEKCNNFQKKDCRIKVLNKKNGGLSDARNYGIYNSQGKYLAFIDSDDYIEKDMIEKLYCAIKKTEADMAICGFFESYSNQIQKKGIVDQCKVFSTEEAIKNITDLYPMAWNKLYKKELFADIRYPVGKYHEDTFVIFQLFEKCSKIVAINDCLYYYIRRKNTISKSDFQVKHLDLIKAWKYNYQFVCDRYPDLEPVIFSKYMMAYFQVLDKILTSDKRVIERNKSYLKSVSKTLKKNKKSIVTSPYITLKRKLLYCLLLLSNQLYKIAITSFQKSI